MGVRAPKDYLDWIRDKDAAILDHMPVTPKFRRGKITRFILEEADSEVLEGLLDVSGMYGEIGTAELSQGAV